MAARSGEIGVAEIKTVRLPCSGKVNVPYLVKAFEAGADGVALITCREDECRGLEGNLRARKRAEAVDALLEEIGLGAGRIAVFPVGDDPDEAYRQLQAFCRGLARLPEPDPALPG